MTIDERLDKLTERHEALTQTVELLVAENRDRDAKLGIMFGQIAESLQRLAKMQKITSTGSRASKAVPRRGKHW